MAHQSSFLDVRSHHQPRRIAEDDDGNIECVAYLDETGHLQAGRGVHCTGQMHRLVRDDTDRATVKSRERCDGCLAIPRLQLENASAVCQRLYDTAHVICAARVFRNDRAQKLPSPLDCGLLKYDRYFCAAAMASASSLTRMSMTPDAQCTEAGPISS